MPNIRGPAIRGSFDIGTRVTSGRAAPIQIHAQVLRQQDFAPCGAMSGFAMMPDNATVGKTDGPQQGARWRQSDVKRAIAAAEKAGLRFYRVEIAPDGTISIVVDTPPPADD